MRARGRRNRMLLHKVFSAVCLFAALVGFAMAQRATAGSEIETLENLLRKNPDDPVIVYNLAAEYAVKQDRRRTLDLLRQLAGLPGGLDPSQYRGFAFVRDEPEFKKLVAEIQRKNIPIVHSKPVFTFAERDLFPEGMAYDPVTRCVYAGSVKRKIVWTDASGIEKELAAPGQDGLAIVLGLHLDAQRRLWAVSSAFPEIKGEGHAETGLFVYDLERHKLVKKILLPPNAPGFLNDVVTTASGEAYTTNTSTGAVYFAGEHESNLQEFLPAETVPGANGIALSDDGRTLFVAGDFGIYRVDLKTKAVQKLAKTGAAIIDGSIDGLYFYRNSLVGIQNGIHPGRIVRFYLDQTLTRIDRWEILEAYNPLFENPTTGSFDGNSLLFFANTQSHKVTFGKPLPPVRELREIRILRIPLS